MILKKLSLNISKAGGLAMFEYCISIGPGTLLDYGVYDLTDLGESPLQFDCDWTFLTSDGDVIFIEGQGENAIVSYYHPVGSDCTTAE
jgi:hypothetical protein